MRSALKAQSATRNVGTAVATRRKPCGVILLVYPMQAPAMRGPVLALGGARSAQARRVFCSLDPTPSVKFPRSHASESLVHSTQAAKTVPFLAGIRSGPDKIIDRVESQT